MCTAAPRLRSATASSRAAARSAQPTSTAVGSSRSTRSPRPAGAASALVGDQAPPSTYSRSVDAHRREDRRDRAGRRDRLPNRSRGRGPAAERDAATIARIDGAHAKRPSNVAPHRSTSSPNAAIDRRPSGSARSASARIGAPTRAATAPAPTRRFDTCRPAVSASANGDRAPAGGSTGRLALASADPGRRGERPATTLAATIEPALVPTNRRQSRTSAPVASSYPARTPVIHASPSSPPPPSTRTFGGLSPKGAITAPRGQNPQPTGPAPTRFGEHGRWRAPQRDDRRQVLA